MCAVVGFHAPVLEMPQSLQPQCVLEGQLLGLPACQQEYDGVLFVTPYLPCVVLQTGAHSAGALALAAIGPSVTTIGARARAHASRRTQRSCIHDNRSPCSQEGETNWVAL